MFDEEAKEVKFWVKPLDASIERKEGDPVYLDEITGEAKWVTIEGEENSLHATFKKTEGNRWLLISSFFYNRTLMRNDITKSQQFLDSAEHAFTKRNWSSFVDSLFSSYELLLRALIVSLPYVDTEGRFQPLISGKTSHKRITRESSLLRHAGLISEERFKMLTKLSRERDKARYGKGEFVKTEIEAKQLLEITHELMKNIVKLTES